MHKILLFPVLLLAASTAAQTGIGTTNPTDQLHTTGTVRFEGYRGVGTRVMQMDSTGRLVVTGGGTVFTNTANFPIPDNGCTTGSAATSSIVVSGHPTPIQTAKISVRVNINHTFDAQLGVYLVAPGGNILNLAASNGLAGDNFTNTVFTDAATVGVGAGSAPFTGKYKPAGVLTTGCLLVPTTATFSGISGGAINPNGTWTLKVFDGVAGTTGTLTDWAISFVSPEDFATVEQNNYVPKFSGGGLVESGIYQSPLTGYVGIGNTTPGYDLDVTGIVYASNKVVVGNTLVTDSLRANGNVAIGGTVKIAGGSPGVGRVLTDTSGDGRAVWQVPITHNSGFRATLVNPYSPVNTNLFEKLPFEATGYDDAGGFVNSTHEYAIPTDGVYHFDVTITTAVSPGTHTITIRNDYVTFSQCKIPYIAGDPMNMTLSISTDTKCVAGDKIWVEVLAVGRTISSGILSSFSGHRVY